MKKSIDITTRTVYKDGNVSLAQITDPKETYYNLTVSRKYSYSHDSLISLSATELVAIKHLIQQLIDDGKTTGNQNG